MMRTRLARARAMFGVRMRPSLVLALTVIALLLVEQYAVAKRSKRWTYPRPQWPVPGHRMDPSPCRLFLWDAGSAARFCTCTRLLEATATTSLWKDSHNQLWLRIPFTSPLLRLFPCQQHSLTRCAKCGHDYEEHLRVAAERQKDRPFEKLIAQNALNRNNKSTPLGFRNVSRVMEEEVGEETRRRGGDKEHRVEKLGKFLTVVAEAQRTSMLHLAGLSVTSATARENFEKVQRQLQQQASSVKTKTEGGSGSTRTGKKYETERRNKTGSSDRLASSAGGGQRRSSTRRGTGGGGVGNGVDSIDRRNGVRHGEGGADQLEKALRGYDKAA